LSQQLVKGVDGSAVVCKPSAGGKPKTVHGYPTCP